jgi:ribosomal protein S18 acetylase RimI-like enzyme
VAKIQIQGTWPGPLTLQRGWYRAAARRWNEDVPMAHFRVERGGAGFLADCTEALLELAGVTGVLSSPLLPGARHPWEEAGFTLHARLLLMRRELNGLAEPEHAVEAGDRRDLGEALTVDRAAFEPFWRLDLLGLREAMGATPRRAIHLMRRPGGGLIGFAVTGVGTSLAYLQRLAVDPPWQSRGIGRSLVRTAAAWAQRQGAAALLLNTPDGGQPAAALYESEGFRTVARDLAVLGRTA